jgi:excisionase family DNA binding protein
MSQDNEKMLRVNVAANRLGYTTRHVRRLVSDEKIEAVRQSPRKTLIPESAVETYRHGKE